MPRTKAFALCIVLMLGSSLRAENSYAATVEWLACSSQRVYVGTITTFDTTPGPRNVTYQLCRLHVDEVLKGDAGDRDIDFAVRSYDRGPTVEPLCKSRTTVLIFLEQPEHPEPGMAGRWTPRIVEHGLPCIDLGNLPKGLYSKSMTKVVDREQLLKLTREWVNAPTRYSLDSEVPFDNPIHNELWAGSAVYLIVPAEEKFRDELMRQTSNDDVWDRAEAARQLFKFPGDQTVRRLRELLDDTGELRAMYSSDEIARYQFVVRAAAAESLRKLGEPVPELAMERQPTAKERLALRAEAWTSSFKEASKGAWEVAVTSGETRLLDQRDRTIVRVTCKSPAGTGRLVLVPKEWPRGEFASLTDLGINGANSQGARRFYVDGDIDASMRATIIRYFGLE